MVENQWVELWRYSTPYLWLLNLTCRFTPQILHSVSEKDESEMLVTLEAQGFLGLVHYTKQVSVCCLIPLQRSFQSYCK